MAEALRELRTNLSFLDVDQPPRIIVVTSSMQAEGKSTVTANLAVTMAAAGENVVVVDGDLRRPTLVDVFNLVPGVGVTDVLTGTAELEDVLQPWGALPEPLRPGLRPHSAEPQRTAGVPGHEEHAQALAQNATVLIDAPPLLPVTDAAVLSRVADGAIVVIRTGKTTQEQLGQSLGNLEKVRGRDPGCRPQLRAHPRNGRLLLLRDLYICAGPPAGAVARTASRFRIRRTAAGQAPGACAGRPPGKELGPAMENPADETQLSIPEAVLLGHALVARVADSLGIRAFFIKGPASVIQGLRLPKVSVDVDVFVPPADLEIAARRLAGARLAGTPGGRGRAGYFPSIRSRSTTRPGRATSTSISGFREWKEPGRCLRCDVGAHGGP